MIEKINHGLVIQLGGLGRCRFSFPNYKIKKKKWLMMICCCHAHHHHGRWETN